MNNVLIAPRKYVQGRCALAQLGEYVKILKKKTLVLWDATVKEITGSTVLASLKETVVDAMIAADALGKSRKKIAG